MDRAVEDDLRGLGSERLVGKTQLPANLRGGPIEEFVERAAFDIEGRNQGLLDLRLGDGVRSGS